MLFCSLIFIFLFFPTHLFFYFINKNRNYRNIILLLFSSIFYLWGGIKYFILVNIIILISYISGLLIDKYKSKKKLIFIISLLLIIGNLIYFKYTNFILDNVNSIFNIKLEYKEIILPIGISFYTFQILSYLIDVYKEKIKVQKNIFLLALYVLLFPQLIAGPIVRYETIENELKDRKETLKDIEKGLKRFIIGLSKKVLIANNVAVVADFIFDNISIYNNEMGTLIVWIGVIAYTIQIYFDFSGYSDMAIGIGNIFGFKFLENFNYPYISKTVTEFWRRWHISLGSWFRDYVYIPLGGNRVNKIRHIFNILVVWSLTGLWHGASWNFIIWGLYYGLILIIEKEIIFKKIDQNKKTTKIVGFIITFILINIGWCIFRVNKISDLPIILFKLINLSHSNIFNLININNIVWNILFIPLGIIFMFPIKKVIDNKIIKNNMILDNTIHIVLFILSLTMLFSSTYNPFIYFRF